MKKYLFLFLYAGMILIIGAVMAMIPEPESRERQAAATPLVRTAKVKEQLPAVGSYAKLKSLLKEAHRTRDFVFGAVSGTAAEKAASAPANAGAPVMKMKTESKQADFSSTNVQVQGVDEADVIKTDGKYIYQVNGQKVIITRAYPAEEMRVVDELDFNDRSFIPHELYVDDKYMAVIGSSTASIPHREEKQGKPGAEMAPYPPYMPYQYVKAVVYNIEDKFSVKRVREVELEGNYVSSRKIGSSLYLVSNKWIDVYYIMNQAQEFPAPMYKDSSGGAERKELDYQGIRYFPESIEPNYLLIGGINLDDSSREMNVSAYLGAGEQIYASTNHLYVTVTRHEVEKSILDAVGKRPEIHRNSAIYKFKLDQGKAEYMAEGSVPGQLLNQFSMDEHNGYFRVATTTGDIWRNDEHTSKNNLYILDEQLKPKGKIEGIAPGEKIYSVRFMGDRGYMVTFRTVDPLFVMDLKDPANPKILGKLKIPGYSDYLHPYDENHIIGFGKDTIESKGGGPAERTMAYYQGMKMALFDITDVTHPKEKFVEIIGDRGTESELLHNHKALLFSKEKNLLSFPVTVMEVKNKSKVTADMLPYGEFVFQGAYVYSIDLDRGFTLRKKITHLEKQDHLKAGDHWFGSDKNVERILYIGDTLYTISKSMIQAHDLQRLEEKNRVALRP